MADERGASGETSHRRPLPGRPVPSRRRRRRGEARDAARLALIPFGVALVLGLLLLPRGAPPEAVPLPIADRRELARAAAADAALAESARRDPLPGPVRALGSAVRDFHVLEAQDADVRDLGAARGRVDAALVEAIAAGDDALLRL